jgi:hypothetical protein
LSRRRTAVSVEDSYIVTRRHPGEYHATTPRVRRGPRSGRRWRPPAASASSLSCTAIGLMAHRGSCSMSWAHHAPDAAPPPAGAAAARTRPLRRPGDANFKETQTIRGQTVVCAAVTDERLRTGDTSRHLSAPSSDHAARHPVGSSRAHLHPMGAIMH